MENVKMTAENVDMSIIVDGSNGVYVPQKFAKKEFTDICDYNGNELNETYKEYLDFLAADDSHETEEYWEVWQDIIDNVCLFKMIDGKRCLYSLHQENDLFAISLNDLHELDDDENNKFWNNIGC
jgi:hypothetical protein